MSPLRRRALLISFLIAVATIGIGSLFLARNITSRQELAAVASAVPPTPLPLYRLYSPSTGHHFYTTSQSEETSVVATGMKLEAIIGYVYPAKYGNFIYQLYRLYNGAVNDHFYTSDNPSVSAAASYLNALKSGYNLEGTIGYLDGNQDADTLPLYGVSVPLSTTIHDSFYTTNTSEYQNVVKNGATDLGIIGYVLATLPIVPPTPPTMPTQPTPPTPPTTTPTLTSLSTSMGSVGTSVIIHASNMSAFLSAANYSVYLGFTLNGQQVGYFPVIANGDANGDGSVITFTIPSVLNPCKLGNQNPSSSQCSLAGTIPLGPGSYQISLVNLATSAYATTNALPLQITPTPPSVSITSITQLSSSPSTIDPGDYNATYSIGWTGGTAPYSIHYIYTSSSSLNGTLPAPNTALLTGLSSGTADVFVPPPTSSQTKICFFVGFQNSSNVEVDSYYKCTTPAVPPSANPGSAQTITLPTNSVTLTGSGTSQTSTIASYAWTEYSGPSNATFSSASTPTTVASGLIAAGSYTFTLTVTDAAGFKGSAWVVVTVNAAPTVKNPTPPTTPPTTPTQPTPPTTPPTTPTQPNTGSSNTAKVSWTATPGSVGYSIYLDGVLDATTTGTSFTELPILMPDTDYTYTIVPLTSFSNTPASLSLVPLPKQTEGFFARLASIFLGHVTEADTSPNTIITIHTAPLPATIPTQGNIKVLAIIMGLKTWFTQSPESTMDTPTNVNTQLQQTAAFYKENSGGKLSITYDVTGPYIVDGGIPFSSLNEDFMTAKQNKVAMTAVNRLVCNADWSSKCTGYNLSNYNIVIYVTPKMPNTAGMAGYVDEIGQIGGEVRGYIWVNGQQGSFVYTHETGHKFGLNHANSISCSDPSYLNPNNINSCTIVTYNDTTDVMGGGEDGPLDMYRKSLLGWAQPSWGTGHPLLDAGVKNGSTEVMYTPGSSFYTINSVETPGSKDSAPYNTGKTDIPSFLDDTLSIPYSSGSSMNYYFDYFMSPSTAQTDGVKFPPENYSFEGNGVGIEVIDTQASQKYPNIFSPNDTFRLTGSGGFYGIGDGNSFRPTGANWQLIQVSHTSDTATLFLRYDEVPWWPTTGTISAAITKTSSIISWYWPGWTWPSEPYNYPGPGTPPTGGYQIYKNGALIATVPPTQTLYVDPTVSAGNSYTYKVCAFDAFTQLPGKKFPTSVLGGCSLPTVANVVH